MPEVVFAALHICVKSPHKNGAPAERFRKEPFFTEPHRRGSGVYLKLVFLSTTQLHGKVLIAFWHSWQAFELRLRRC